MIAAHRAERGRQRRSRGGPVRGSGPSFANPPLPSSPLEQDRSRRRGRGRGSLTPPPPHLVGREEGSNQPRLRQFKNGCVPVEEPGASLETPRCSGRALHSAAHPFAPTLPRASVHFVTRHSPEHIPRCVRNLGKRRENGQNVTCSSRRHPIPPLRWLRI